MILTAILAVSGLQWAINIILLYIERESTHAAALLCAKRLGASRQVRAWTRAHMPMDEGPCRSTDRETLAADHNSDRWKRRLISSMNAKYTYIVYIFIYISIAFRERGFTDPESDSEMRVGRNLAVRRSKSRPTGAGSIFNT